ncbi:MAG: hypothetical protein CSA19_01975, partial [Deltaproteobacteria bacterium]
MSSIILSIALDALFASLAGLGFAYVAGAPRRTLLLSATLSALGHSSRYFLLHVPELNIVLSTFLASLLIGLLGTIMAKKAKTPIEIISFPALLPMVPGVFAYKSILALFSFIQTSDIAQKQVHLVMFFDNFLTTLTISIALAVGVGVALLLF